MDLFKEFCELGEHNWMVTFHLGKPISTCIRCGIDWNDYNKVTIECECGAEKLKHPGHSEWCQKYRRFL